MRHAVGVSQQRLLVNGAQPMLLNSTVTNDNSLLTVDLANPDYYEGDRLMLPKGTLHIFRGKLLWHGVLHEHLRLMNYACRSCRSRSPWRWRRTSPTSSRCVACGGRGAAKA